MGREAIEGLLFWLPAFLFSTTLHEAAHAWAALRLGDPTAYEGGQVTLSPIPHIRREPIGMLVVPVVTALANGWAMGWASAPFDPRWAASHPRRAAWMALAGPAANAVLAALAFAGLAAGNAAGVFVVPGTASFSQLVVAADAGTAGGLWDFAGRALSVVLMLNVLLATFNLLPVPPLDGATAIDLLLPRRWMGALRRLGSVGSLVGLVLAWRVFPMLARPLFSAVLGLLHPGSF